MLDALWLARHSCAPKQGLEDTLNRYHGGFWAPPGAHLDGKGKPKRYAATGTILGLIRRKLVTVTQTAKNGERENPIQVRITEGTKF